MTTHGELSLMVEMVIILGAASIGGYGANRLGQPVLLGYLLGGMTVGPAGLSLISLQNNIEVLSKVGVALLLFALGVEFSLKQLMRVGRIALGGGMSQILLTLLLGGGLAYLTGSVDSFPKALFLGAVLSLSSTAVVLKSLIERNEVQTVTGQVMLAILIVQDLCLGLMLAIFPAFSQPPDRIGVALFYSLVKVTGFLAFSVLASKWLIPRCLRLFVRSGSQELLLLFVLGLCLGIALLTSQLGLGIEMGAFVAGLMVSNVEYADHVLDLVFPLRDVFATLFFASIGLLIDPAFLWAHSAELVGLVTIVMVGKALISTVVVWGFGYPLKTALTVGLGINQIGEFSFVLAGVARDGNFFPEPLYGLVVGTTALTLLITPFLLKATPQILTYLEEVPWLKTLLEGRTGLWIGYEVPLQDHVVVAGYGRVGQTLTRMLYFQGYQVLVIDNNEAQLFPLRERGISYLFGDASSISLLEKAHLHQAKAMAIALPDPMATRLSLQRSLGLAPELDITVRAHSKDEIDVLYQLGAQEVVQPEFEASLEMGAHLLLKLGDSPGEVQQVVHRYRTSRYRDILPERSEYWGGGDMELATEGLQRQWYVIGKECPLLGISLGQANARRRTGATVMLIERGGQVLRFPTGESIVELGDRLLVVGDFQALRAFSLLISAQSQSNT